MPLVSVGAFLAGVATGWTGRSLMDPTREGLVRVIITGFRLRDEVRRATAQYAEFMEDLVAEGRSRYGLMQEERAEAHSVAVQPSLKFEQES